jgi:hypothetical protein
VELLIVRLEPAAGVKALLLTLSRVRVRPLVLLVVSVPPLREPSVKVRVEVPSMFTGVLVIRVFCSVVFLLLLKVRVPVPLILMGARLAGASICNVPFTVRVELRTILAFCKRVKDEPAGIVDGQVITCTAGAVQVAVVIVPQLLIVVEGGEMVKVAV